jgi:cytochrome P450 monooxygenase
MSKWLFLFRHQKWLDAVAIVHDFIDRHIDRTYKELEDMEGNKIPDPKRTDLLWYMCSNLKDKEALRSHVLLLFIPNNDTTSIFISHAIYNLARRPDVWAKVHAEVDAYNGAELTFEALRSMKYLNAVLNESM